MSKKKPTAPIPLTGVVTITTDGRTTLAMKASHRGEDIQVSTGTANCRPGDVYSEYEGARIALARLYGLEPFPNAEDKSQEKGHWEKATKENCKVGSQVRVAHAAISFDTYKGGDTGVVGSWFASNMVKVKFDRKSVSNPPACFLDELEVWVPGTQEVKPKEDKTEEKGHWEKATMENAKVGSRVKVVAAMYSSGAYRNGDQGILQDAPRAGDLRHIVFDGKKTYTVPGCWLSELEVWVPDAPEEAKPQEAPIPEAPKPFTPSFQVGDIVRLSETDDRFRSDCRGKVGKVCQVNGISNGKAAYYVLKVNINPGKMGPQYCTEWPDASAPLELLFRDPQKDGEKA